MHMTLALKVVRNEAMKDGVLAGRMAYWVETFRLVSCRILGRFKRLISEFFQELIFPSFAYIPIRRQRARG